MRITKGQRVQYTDDASLAGGQVAYLGVVVGKVMRRGEWFVHINFDDGQNADYNGNFELHRVAAGYITLVGA